MESDRFDAVVAEAAGIAASIQNVRGELKSKSWLRAVPEKVADGEIQRWHVGLANAAPDRASRRKAVSRDLDCSSEIRDPDPEIPGTRTRALTRRMAPS